MALHFGDVLKHVAVCPFLCQSEFSLAAIALFISSFFGAALSPRARATLKGSTFLFHFFAVCALACAIWHALLFASIETGKFCKAILDDISAA